MTIQQSFTLLSVLSFLTAFAAEMPQFTLKQWQILSRINNDPCFAPSLNSIPGFIDDVPFLNQIASTAYEKVKEAAKMGLAGNTETGLAGNTAEIPVLRDKGKGCVRVFVKRNEDSIWFISYFYFDEKLSLLIQNDQGTIVFAGMPGSVLGEEKYAVCELFSQLRRHKKYPEMIEEMSKIIGWSIVDSFAFEAVVLASGGLEHTVAEATRIDNCIQAVDKHGKWRVIICIPNDETLEVMPVGVGGNCQLYYCF